jgi:hypothetical protein
MLGNSLGIDRHGTNVRRHHVSIAPSSTQRSVQTRGQEKQRSLLTRLFVSFPTLKKRKSSDLLRMAAQSTESLRRLSQRHKRRWDFGGLRSKMVRRRERKEQVKRERYREGIKGRIGAPVYVDA